MVRQGAELRLIDEDYATQNINNLIEQRKITAQSFYEKIGFDQDKIVDHLRGIDFNKPVEVITIKKGTEAIQYQIPGAPVGNYFALPNSPGNQLGFYTSGRVAKSYIATEDFKALESTAASTIDDWSMRQYGWEIETPGGSKQFFTNPNLWKLKK